MLDNAFIHHNQICFTKKLDDMLLIYVQILIDMYEKADIQLKYLSSYLFNFNFIEQFFVQLKM